LAIQLPVGQVFEVVQIGRPERQHWHTTTSPQTLRVLGPRFNDNHLVCYCYPYDRQASTCWGYSILQIRALAHKVYMTTQSTVLSEHSLLYGDQVKDYTPQLDADMACRDGRPCTAVMITSGNTPGNTGKFTMQSSTQSLAIKYGRMKRRPRVSCGSGCRSNGKQNVQWHLKL
jgi:hypothetical protein